MSTSCRAVLCGKLPCLFSLSVVLLAGWPVQAENWSRFRGPNGSGLAVEATFPATWTEHDYLWKKELPGTGSSSPVCWEDLLFVSSSDTENGDVVLQCLIAGSGEQLWQRKLAGQTYPMHRNNSYTSATPTVDQQHVYLTWAAGGKIRGVAFSHQGQEIWRTHLGDFVGSHGFAASPVVVEGVVCVQVDQDDQGFLVGLDALSGNVRWRAERPSGKATYSTPCVISIDDERLAVISQSTAGGMQAIEVQTGEVIWQKSELFPERCVSSPIAAGNFVLGVCGSGGGGKSLVGIDLATSQPPRTQFTLSKQIPYVPTPLAKDNWLFLWHDQGKVSLVDLDSENPRHALWTKRVGGNFFGSPVLAGNKIYCLSTAGQAVVIAADHDFKLLGKNDLGAPTNATPAIHRGRMYLRTESSLACLPAE